MPFLLNNRKISEPWTGGAIGKRVTEALHLFVNKARGKQKPHRAQLVVKILSGYDEAERA